MKSGLLVLALALSACTFDDLDLAGRACGAGDDCPAGLTCDPDTHTCERGLDLSVPDMADDLAPIPCVDPPDAGASYVIYRLPESASVNLQSALCDEPVWATIPPVVFSGPNTTDNQPVCRLAWQPGPPDVIYGCCDVTDTDIRGNVMLDDGNVYLDDGIEYVLKLGLDRVFDATTSKIQINALGFYADGNYPTGFHDSLYDARVVTTAKVKGTLNDTVADMRYYIKWRADVGFAVAPPAVGRCDFLLSDLDRDISNMEVRKTWTAYGNLTNDPTQWQTCLLSCTPPP